MLALGACGDKESNGLDFGSIEEISEEEFSAAFAQAGVNSRYLSKIEIENNKSFDNTGLYSGGLSLVAKKSVQKESLVAEIGTNYFARNTIKISSSLTDCNGTLNSEMSGVTVQCLMKDPNSTASIVPYDLCLFDEYTIGGISSSYSSVNVEGFATDENVNSVFEIYFVLSLTDSNKAFSTTYSTIGKSGDAIIAYTKTISTNSESNVLYPGDATKNISYNTIKVNAIKLVKDAKLGYVLAHQSVSEIKSYVTDYELEKVDSPIVVNENIGEISYKYEELKSLGSYSYPVEAEEKPELIVSTFSSSSPYGLISSSNYNLADVTGYEKSINKDYTGTKYSGIVKICPNDNYISFSTKAAIEADTPNYGEFGFSSINEDSLLGNSIEDAGIADHNFISIQNGYYSISVEFDAKGALKLLSLSFISRVY